MSLRLKLIITFLAVALIPLFFVSGLTYQNYKNSLETTRLSNLQDIAAFKTDKIETYFAELKNNIEITQGFYNIKKNLPMLTRLAGDPNNPQAVNARKTLVEQLQHMQSVLHLSDIMLVNLEGKVVFANKSGHYSKDMPAGFDAEQKAFSQGKDMIYISDIYFDTVDDNRFEILITAPVFDFNSAFIGVIVFEVDMTSVYNLIQDTTGLGKTGETLIGRRIGNEAEFLTPLRYDPKAAFKRKVAFGDASALPIQQAVQGNSGVGQSVDYRGQKVIAAWRHIPSLNWGMVAKIDTQEAFAEVTKLRSLAIIILAMVIVLSSITAFSIAKSISGPLKKLAEGAAIIGQGNLDYKIDTHLNDEIGQLARSFDKMTRDLKQTTASRNELNEEIRERKKAEKALIAAHQRLVLAQQSAGAGIWDWDLTTGKLEWSPELFCLFGLDSIKDHSSFDLWRSILHPQDRELVEKRIEQAIQNQTTLDSEYRIVLPDNQVRWINALGSAIYDHNGQPQSMSGICIDVTERKKVEEALSRERDFSSAVLDTAGALVVVLDKEGRITRFNRECEVVTGYTSGEVFGRTLWEFLIPGDELESVRQTWETLKAGDFPLKHKNHWVAKNGSQRFIAWSNTAITYPGGIIGYIIATGVDITEQKQAEEALRQSREDLNRAQAVSHVGSWRLNVQRNELVWSDENHRIFGIPKGTQMTYETFLSAVHPEDRDYVDSKWKAGLQGEGYDIEHRIIADGKTRWVREKAYLEFDPHGVLLGGFGTTQDVTERKQAEEAILVSEVRYRRLFEAARDGILILDANSGQIVDVNPFIEEMLGYSHAEFLHKKLWEIGLFKNIAASKETFLDLQNQGYIRHENLPLETKDGRRIAVEFVSNIYMVDHKKVIQCNIRDITNRVGAEEALRKSRDELEMRVKERTHELAETVNILENEVRERIGAEKAVRQGEERYRSLTVATTQVVWTTDAQGQVIADMPSWRTFTGQSEEEIKGWGWINALHPEDRDRTAKIWTQSVQKKNLYQTEYRIRRHDGIYLYMSVRGVPVIEPDGSIREWVGTCTDITERELAEERHRVTNRLMELFAKKTSRKEYLDAVVKVVGDWSHCQCIGIRLTNSDGSIPYVSCVGFSDEFLAMENMISLHHDTCACVRIIAQTPDPQELSVITSKGSFRCANTVEFHSGLSEKDKDRYRSGCPRCGFASVAVIPIRYREKVLGAIHLADKQVNKTPHEDVEFLENMAVLIGEALYRFDTEISLRSSQARLMEAQRIAHLGNWEWDIEKNSLHWSDEVYRIFGTQPGEFEVTYDAFINFIQPQDRPLVQQAIANAIDLRLPYNLHYWLVRKDGIERIVHAQGEVIYNEHDKPVRMIGTVQDVTEQELTSKELRQSQEKLRSLATEIVLTEERERRTIAAALHDSLGPLLAFSKRELGIIRKSAPEDLTESLAYVHDKIKQAVDQTRNLTFDLSPATLYTLGLEHALEELVEHFSREGRFNGVCHAGEIVEPLTEDIKILLYRSVRELMVNIVKHAGAKNVAVTLAMTGNDIQVAVEDDGVGFDVSGIDLKTGKLKGFGLFNIQERLIQAGGRIDIQSPQNGGIKIVLQLPLTQKKEA
jgi:PAS domain S-box-containing protein